MTALLTIFLSYLSGTIPFGYLVARFVAGMDIRSEGSGNIGATNIARVLGAKWGVLVLVLDALKGFLPVFFLPGLLLESNSEIFSHVQVASGLATVVGHMFPVWLKFKGGKGVATALGVILVLGPWASLAALGMFLLSFLIFRIVSLSSILASSTFAIIRLVTMEGSPFSSSNWSLTAFSILVPLLIIVRHRSNIVRLLNGTEPRFRSGQKKNEDHSETEPSTDPSE